MIPKGIYRFGKDYATLSIDPKNKVYDERTVRRGKDVYRVWDPTKSKLSAALHKGANNVVLFKGMKILYLGISNGTTASHLSDIIGNDGMIYGVEFAPRPVRDLMYVCQSRKNIAPILADARMPEDYASLVEKVDLVYCDVAAPDQTDILIRNAKTFLKKGSYLMIAIKARSIDVTMRPSEIYAQERRKLEESFNVLEQVNLHPLEKDHAFIVARMKK